MQRWTRWILNSKNPFVDLSTIGNNFKLNPNDLLVFPDFISKETASHLHLKCLEMLKQKTGSIYQKGHFDHVISGYRECQVSQWNIKTNEEFKELFEPCTNLFPKDTEWLPPHILELENENSYINAHVDHLQASGSCIMGICLHSPAVMIFRHVKDPSNYFTALLPENCAYIQRNQIRYEFSHEIPTGSLHCFKNKFIDRKQRIAILLRDVKRH